MGVTTAGEHGGPLLCGSCAREEVSSWLSPDGDCSNDVAESRRHSSKLRLD